MTAITHDFGSGGSGLTPQDGDPDLATTLREIAGDLATLKGAVPSANITVGALPTFTDPPSAAEMLTLKNLVNELRAYAIEQRAVQAARAGATLLTTAP
jgi:hypothetical protein